MKKETAATKRPRTTRATARPNAVGPVSAAPALKSVVPPSESVRAPERAAPLHRLRIDRRFLLSGGILLAVILALLLSNAVFFLKRAGHQLNPPVVELPSPPTATDPYLLDLAGVPDRILIPSLGIDAPLVESATRTQAAYKLALQQGVAHFPGTPGAGGVGNAYYFGHSSDLPWAKGDYKTIFALLPEIAIGAKIYLTDHDGSVYAYAADGTEIVLPSDLSVLADPGNGKRTLTLQTSYPLGTALRRFIVTAELVGEILVR